MSGDDMDARIRAADRIVAGCRPWLAGEDTAAQGLALAELVSIWLLGFQAKQVAELRAHLLRQHVESVRDYIAMSSIRNDNTEVIVEDEDGQPTEQEEWNDYDKDC